MKQKEWNRAHTCCPQCKNPNVIKTEKAPIVADIDNFTDDVNMATCPLCAWKGMVKQLIQNPADLNEVKNLNVELRTIDKVDNEGNTHVYISAEDCVGSIRNFGMELIPALKDDGAKVYTEQLLSEIIKIFISADVTHRAEKIKKLQQMEENAKKDAENTTETENNQE